LVDRFGYRRTKQGSALPRREARPRGYGNRHAYTMPFLLHRAMSTSARIPVNLRDVSLEQPSRLLLVKAGRWIWAKLMNYDVIIITDSDLSDDPAFVYPFKANKIEDFEVGVREAIAEWRRYNPNQNLLEAGCTVLVEKAVLSCSALAVAEQVS
jgi:hypothetical protein